MLPPTMDPLLRHKLMQIGAVVCFLFLICGACRLARFNISADAQPKNPGRPDRKYFVGMPIPAAAGVIAACVHYFLGTPVSAGRLPAVWIGLVGLVGFLMVSTWRFWSGKEITLTGSSSVSVAGADWRGCFSAAVVFSGITACDRVGLYVFRIVGAGGIFLDVAASAE